MTTWFTSDLHLGHVRILEICRPDFATVDEMNETIIDLWNSVVREDDLVYVLGDVCMGRKAETVPLLSRLRGHKMLVAGNHDPMHPAYGEKREWKRDEWTQTYLDAGFEHIWTGGVFLRHTPAFPNELGTTVMLHHMPYEGDHTEDERYSEFRPTNIGLPLLHGHVHDSWKVRVGTQHDTDALQINVGVDVWDYQPVSAQTLADIITNKENQDT